MLPVNQVLLMVFPGADTAPTVGYLIAALMGSVGYSLIAGAATAWIARQRATIHGVWGGVALLAVGVTVELSVWDLLPLWYHLAFLAMLIPVCVAGAAWFGRRSGEPGATPSTSMSPRIRSGRVAAAIE